MLNLFRSTVLASSSRADAFRVFLHIFSAYDKRRGYFVDRCAGDIIGSAVTVAFTEGLDPSRRGARNTHAHSRLDRKESPGDGLEPGIGALLRLAPGPRWSRCDHSRR